MRITTWNVNGLRAALRKSFARHVDAIAPDVLLLQEIRSTPEQLPAEWADPDGWHVAWHPAERLGYSGVAVWSRLPIKVLERGAGDADPEGRVLTAKTGPVRVSSVYLPSGSSAEHRQAEKDRWLGFFDAWAEPKLRSRVPTLLAGDFNIAHTERDIFHAKSNQKTSGFLPHEREWMGRFIDAGWRDLVREEAGDVHGPYTWWSNRGRARELDRGWRIDYLMGNRALARRAVGTTVHREGGLDTSDHAPVSVDLDLA